MHRHTHGQGSHGAKAGCGVADWQALEVQLNRTRVMLQEILVHLQDVLKNLRAARTGGPAASARPGAEQTRGGAARDSRFRTQATPPPGASDRFSRTQHTQGPAGQTASAGASDRGRFKARPHFEAKGATAAGPAGNGQTAGSAHQRTAGFGPAAGEDKTRAGAGRTGQSTFRAHAGHAGTHRERPRQESTFRARTAGPETDAGSRAAGQQSRTFAGSGQGASQGASRASAQGQAAGASRPHARPRPEREGFRPDDERQHRAREAARKNGMNLKCAYDILCLNYPCSVDEIKNAYRHMARRHHPDLGGDEEAMKDVNVAYELAMRFSAGRRTTTAWAV